MARPPGGSAAAGARSSAAIHNPASSPLRGPATWRTVAAMPDRTSGREAARILARRGLTVTQTQALLSTGLAGDGEVDGRSVRYDGERVRELAARPQLLREEVDRATPDGLVVLRLWPAPSVRVDDPWPAQQEVLRGPWRTGWKEELQIVCYTMLGREIPVVAAVAGFVVLVARIAGATFETAGLGLDVVPARADPPRADLRDWVGRRLPLTRGPRFHFDWQRQPRRLQQ